jgi:thiol-disulfide isomerase/thioredoxin
MTTEGSTFDTVLAVYTGNSMGSLTPVASNDDDGSITTSRVSFEAIAGTTYRVAVDGYRGASGQVTLNIRVGAWLAPGWDLLDVYGNPLSWSDYAGQVILLNFWATWCGPCVGEIPDLIALQERYRADGLAVIGLSIEANGQATVGQFALDYGINYRVAIGTAQIEQDYGGISAVPTTFLIDRENRVVSTLVGSRTEAQFGAMVLPLLRELRLRTRCTPEGPVLAWPAAQSGYVLEYSPTVGTPSWHEVPGPFTEDAGYLTFAVPPPGASAFYRLRR